jgi:hypothetical protein
MLEFLRERASDRKLRLFACACCRGIQGFIPAGPCREAVEVSLGYADGQATADELAAARSAAVSAASHAGSHSAAAWAACETANPSAFRAAWAAAEESRELLRKQSPRAAEDEARAQAGFLRDIIGDPFRPVRARPLRHLDRHPVVREIAEELYADAPVDDMKALADHLERLGCPAKSILEHCRSVGPHVRGCWVIDLILGHEVEMPEPPERVEQVERVPTSRMRAVREALARHLGPKKYRRFIRKAVSSAPGPGRVDRPAEWDEFVRLHPGYDLDDDELAEVCAVCTVHGCELVQKVVSGVVDDPALLRDPKFLEARGTRFPHSHAEETDAEWERPIWWCPQCQEARDEWMQSRAGLPGGMTSERPGQV